MKKLNIKNYSKLVMALVSAGVISGSMAYFSYIVKVESSRKNDIMVSANEGMYLVQKVGKDILLLGQDYLGSENLNESQFNGLMDSKTEFDAWLNKLSLEPEFKVEVESVNSSWKDLSEQLSFLRNFYNNSVKNLSNPVESMMVNRKNRAFLITANSDNLPNDIPAGAEDTITNQRIEYNSPIKQTLKVQVENSIKNYKAHSTEIMTSLNKIVDKSKAGEAAIKAEAIRSFMYIALSTFGLMLLSFFILRSKNGKVSNDNSAQELALILHNVKEGMFVMNTDWEITGNISESLGDVLNKELIVGDNFYEFIQSKVDTKTSVLSKDYLKLLIEKNLNQKLVSSVNPLKLVNISSPINPKFISVSLNPIKDSVNSVSKILVTVSDSSEHKALEDSIKTEKKKSSNQFDFLLNIMQSKEQDKFIEFFHKLQEVVCDQNEILKTNNINTENLSETLSKMQHEIHTLKAEASVLNLGLYQVMLHDFEDKILEVKKKDNFVTEDVHVLSFFHKELLEKTGGLISALEVALISHSKGQDAESAILMLGAEMSNSVSSLPLSLDESAVQEGDDKSTEIDFHPGIELQNSGLQLLDVGDMPMTLDSFNNSIIKPSESLASDLSVLIKNGADRNNKKINLSLNLSKFDLLSENKRDTVRSILMHLVNNAVAHGIETVNERTAKNKYPIGVIQVYDEVVMDGIQELINIYVVDDGLGLNLDRIKERAIELGLNIGGGTQNELIPLIFKPDFSTNKDVDLLSGRGIGLDFVKTEVDNLGGSISLKMKQGNYFELSFKFALNDF